LVTLISFLVIAFSFIPPVADPGWGAVWGNCVISFVISSLPRENCQPSWLHKRSRVRSTQFSTCCCAVWKWSVFYKFIF